MRRILTMLFFVLIACMTQTTEARKVAVLIGVDDYANIQPLKCGGCGYFTKNFAVSLSGAANFNRVGRLTLMEAWTTEHTKSEVLKAEKETLRPYFSGSISDFTLAEDLNVPKAKDLVPEANKARDKEIMELTVKKRDASIAQNPKPESDQNPKTTASSNKPGDRMVKVVNGVEFAFRWCPPGTFMMGSPESEERRKNDEHQHQVTLTEGFWMMETEVTHEQWKAIMGENPNKEYQNWRSFAEKYPVDTVSWNDCQIFCQKCTELGLSIQLPTEAQWEYACRAGTTEMYAGDIYKLATFGQYAKNVKAGEPNNWGLYDMHGNVFELCSDWYGSYPNKNVTDPQGPSTGKYRVMRGGCYQNAKEYCRSANRGKCLPDFKIVFLGFRCVIGKGVHSTYIPIAASDKPKSNVTQISDFGQGVKAGERKTAIVNGVEFAFRWCPPGTFTMGSPLEEPGRSDDETQYRVTLSKGFWIMETEVTQEQWMTVMDKNSSFFKNDKNPVEIWFWNDCLEFCKKCTELGLPLEIPKEAQWEYACRAGSDGAYSGNLDEIAWYKGNSGARTHAVGKKKPNAWGLYDMHGNMSEWCHIYIESNPDEKEIKEAILRGGCWESKPEDCRSASRSHQSKHWGIYYDSGLRCVLSSDTEITLSKIETSALPNKKTESAVQKKSNPNAGKRKVINVNGVEFAFRYCPPGTFKMGLPKDEDGAEMLCIQDKRDYINKIEKQHEVTLTKGFWIMETEVTVGMYKAFIDETGYKPDKKKRAVGINGYKTELDAKYSWLNPGFIQNENFPVTCVTWHSATAFCEWLSKKTGLKIQLPTEAQWEYACSAGNEDYIGIYTNNDDIAWTGNNSDSLSHPVKTKKSNAWGLYDTMGNVCEWCQDWYGDYPDEAVTDPTGPSNGEDRALRGGCYTYRRTHCRTSARTFSSPDLECCLIGFRCIIANDSLSISSKTEDAASADRNKESVIQDSNGDENYPGKREITTVNGVEFAFRYCPYGTFKMGSIYYEHGHLDSEIEHQILLTNGFWILETEVTVGMFKAFVNDSGYKPKGNTPQVWNNTSKELEDNPSLSWTNPGYEQDDNYPVTCVSWDDAAAFCEWLSKKTGKSIQLPTEAQWEYASRSGSIQTHYVDGERCWYEKNSDNHPHPVGKKNKNAWGLYDMQGNASEWCADWHEEYKNECLTDPKGPANGEKRVHRGGRWNSRIENCRFAYRDSAIPAFRSNFIGFRCVKGEQFYHHICF